MKVVFELDRWIYIRSVFYKYILERKKFFEIKVYECEVLWYIER